jgi:hypothetical protein
MDYSADITFTDTISSFLEFAHRLNFFKSTTFRKPDLLPSSRKETPNLVDSLDRAILSHCPATENSSNEGR